MKKSKYSDLYTLRPDGRYQGYYRDAAGKRHVVNDKDPEQNQGFSGFAFPLLFVLCGEKIR